MPREASVLSAVSFTVALGYGIVAPAIPAFARQFGVSVAASASVISAFALMRVVGALPAGRLVDRFGERIIMAIGIAVVAVSSVLAGFSGSFVQLLVLRGVGGLGSAMFSVSAQALLLASVPSGQRGRASGLYSGGFLLGGISGPAVGGIVAAWSLRAPFFLYGGLLLIPTLIAAVVLRSTPTRRAATPDTAGSTAPAGAELGASSPAVVGKAGSTGMASAAGAAREPDADAITVDGDAGSVDGDAGSVDGDAGSVDGDAGSVDGDAGSANSGAGSMDGGSVSGAGSAVTLDGAVTVNGTVSVDGGEGSADGAVGGMDGAGGAAGDAGGSPERAGAGGGNPSGDTGFGTLVHALRSSAYRAAAAANMADGFAALGVRGAIVPLFVRDSLHRSAVWTGVGFLLYAALNGVALLPAGRAADVIGRRPVIIAGCAISAGGMAMLAILPGLWAFLAALAVAGLGSGLLDVAPAAMIGDLLGGRGGIMIAFYQMAGDIGSVTGPIAAGLLVDAASYSAAFALAAAVLGAAAVLAFLSPETRSSTLGASG